MYLIYTWALRLGLTVISPFYLLRSRKYWHTISDRVGLLKIPRLRNTIWLHAVSVGEVKTIERLVEKLRAQYPQRPLVVSTTTPTGQQLARKRTDIISQTFYFPFDLPGAVKRALDRIRPDLVIVAETEIWPNFLRICRRRGIPVMMINGRISDNSWPRYRRFRKWLRPVLDNYAVLGMQSEIDRRRIEDIGADSGRVQVFGNLKYDVAPAQSSLDPRFAEFLRGWGEVWIAASTMQGEDEMIVDTYLNLKRSRPSLRLMIAPRHPERAGEIIDLVRARGTTAARRSSMKNTTDILVLDTIGELAAAFEFASVVFMGGSLVPRGGHNILEPARFAKPIVFGPHMENFREISRVFLQAHAAIQITDAADLAPAVARMLDDVALASELGRNAHRVLLENTGATDRVLSFIRDLESFGVQQ